MRLDGKVAIVTGAGGGFGAGIAQRFAAEGASVACLDIDRASAERIAAGIGQQALAIGADVGSAADWEAAVAATRERFGVPHILVNNAGTTHRNKPLMEVTEAEFDRVFQVNVKSIFHAVRAVAPPMREQGGGVILNVSSTAALRPRPGLTWYNASKGAASLATKSLALELAPWKIRVNALCPVMGATGLLEHFMGVPDTPENRERFVATIPLGRLSEARDIAAAALFLASDEAAFITGTTVDVNGGLFMR
jgi:3-oxoacyl-[acyl-carrier protein] reductase